MTTPRDDTGDNFVVQYNALASVERYQDWSFRFGHSDNITEVFETGSTKDTTDYVLGLIFAGAIILGFFLIWCITLMVFMCIGHRVGFLSGAHFIRKPQDDREDSAHDDDDTNYDDEGMDISERFAEAIKRKQSKPQTHGDRWKSRPTRCRIFFVISGIICITFGILMVTQGITNLQTSINTVDNRANDLNAIAASAQQIINEGMRDLRSTAETIRSIVLDDLSDEKFCPDDPQVTGSEVGRDIKENKDDAVKLLNALSDFSDQELADLDSAMTVIFDGTTEITKESDKYSVNDWESLIVLIPYTVFPSFLIVAAIMAFYDVSLPKYNCFINWFVLPVFILMTVVAFTFAAAMSFAAGVNADFCLPGGRTDGSPDETILSVMQVRGYDGESFPYRVTKFYIDQCAVGVEDPLLDIREYEPSLRESLDSLDELIADITNENKIDELAVYCNREFDVLEPILVSMKNIVTTLLTALISLLDLVKCGRIIPLYTDTTYKAGCEYAPSAVFWVFSCCLVLGFFGMCMITARSSMKTTLVDSDYVGHFPRTESQSLRHEFSEGVDEVEEVKPNPNNLEEEVRDEGEEVLYSDEAEQPSNASAELEKFKYANDPNFNGDS